MLRLLAGTFGESDDREAGDTALQMRFDLDPARLEPDERMREGAGNHSSTLRAGLIHVCADFVPVCLKPGTFNFALFAVILEASSNVGGTSNGDRPCCPDGRGSW
jgi:hypothetical protein